MATYPLQTYLGQISRVIRERLAAAPLLDELDPAIGSIEVTLEKYTMYGITMTLVDPRDGVQYELLLRPTPLHDYIPTEPSAIRPQPKGLE